jgi:hypothetical protein
MIVGLLLITWTIYFEVIERIVGRVQYREANTITPLCICNVYINLAPRAANEAEGFSLNRR